MMECAKPALSPLWHFLLGLDTPAVESVEAAWESEGLAKETESDINYGWFHNRWSCDNYILSVQV